MDHTAADIFGVDFDAIWWWHLGCDGVKTSAREQHNGAATFGGDTNAVVDVAGLDVDVGTVDWIAGQPKLLWKKDRLRICVGTGPSVVGGSIDDSAATRGKIDFGAGRIYLEHVQHASADVLGIDPEIAALCRHRRDCLEGSGWEDPDGAGALCCDPEIFISSRRGHEQVDAARAAGGTAKQLEAVADIRRRTVDVENDILRRLSRCCGTLRNELETPHIRQPDRSQVMRIGVENQRIVADRHPLHRSADAAHHIARSEEHTSELQSLR